MLNTKKRPLIVWILVFSSVLISLSCNESDQEDIPYVYVNFTINPQSIEYGDLDIPGNYAYVTGGYRGIIIYHRTQNDFYAYERACTFDPLESDARVEVGEENTLISCPSCGSRYLMLDGSPFDGPAIRSLRQYKTHYDGFNLTVTN